MLSKIRKPESLKCVIFWKRKENKTNKQKELKKLETWIELIISKHGTHIVFQMNFLNFQGKHSHAIKFHS